MIEAADPRRRPPASSVRRFRKVLSGVISEGLIPVSNRLLISRPRAVSYFVSDVATVEKFSAAETRGGDPRSSGRTKIVRHAAGVG